MDCRWMMVVLSFIICHLSFISANAQSVTAKIDPIEMMMGEQAQVTLTVQAPEGATVEWPKLQPRQQLVEGKLYYLPPFKVKVNGKEVASKSLALKVLEVEVDTTKLDKYFGPKDVQDNPYQWSDWSPSFWFSVLLLILLAVSYYLYLRLRAGKPIIAHIKIVKRLLPHQKAMKEIEQIKADKMVTSENPKEYYTKLTETLRRYIEERYGFSAMEMTSSEIIDRLMSTGDQQSLDELRQLFTTADLVKFAKYSTMINENDANLVSAIDFINQTKLENQPTEVVQKPQLSEEDQRTRKERRILKTVIGVLCVVMIALLCYVIYNIYQLLN